MESFFYQGQPAYWWFDEAPERFVRKPSHFVPYLELEWVNVGRSEQRNVKKRVVGMLMGRWRKAEEAKMPRSFRHAMKERLRRQSHKEGFTRLRAILPIGTKSDKISVTAAAGLEILRTRRVLEDLQRRNRELNAMGKDRVRTVRIRVGDPISGIDSMVEVLHCLNDLGSDIRRLRSQFSDNEFSAEIEVYSQIAEDEMEKQVQKTLVKEKLLRQQSSMP